MYPLKPSTRQHSKGHNEMVKEASCMMVLQRVRERLKMHRNMHRNSICRASDLTNSLKMFNQFELSNTDHVIHSYTAAGIIII